MVVCQVNGTKCLKQKWLKFSSIKICEVHITVKNYNEWMDYGVASYISEIEENLQKLPPFWHVSCEKVTIL